MAYNPPNNYEEYFGKPQTTYKTTGTQYTRGDYKKMNYYDQAIKQASRQYAQDKGFDPDKFESAFRYILQDQRVQETDTYKRTQKYQQQREDNRQKERQRNFDNILKTIDKGKNEYGWSDPNAEKLNNTLNNYRNYYGTNVNSPVTQADLSNFEKYMELMKKGKEPEQEVKQPKEENNLLEKFLRGNAEEYDDTDRGGVLGFLDKTLGRVSHNAGKTLFGDAYVPYDEETKKNNPIVNEVTSKADNLLEKGADITGTIAGYAAPLGTAYKVTGKGAQLGYKGIDKLVQTLNKGKGITKGGKYINDAVKGAAAMGAYSGTREGLGELTNPDSATLGERLGRIGIETAGGAIGDPLARVIGTGIKIGGSKLLSRYFGKNESTLQELKQAIDSPDIPQEVKQEILALPEGQKILALQEGKTQTAIPFKRTQSEYTQKFNRLIEEANKLDMYPGREREIVEDLWNRMKDYEDPSLDELIDLAAPSFKNQQALDNPNLIQQARQNQNNAVYGVGTFNKLKKVNEPIVTPKKGEPLQFKRTIEQPKLEKLVEDLQNVSKPKEQYENISSKDGGDLTYVDNDGNFHDYDATELKDISGFTAATTDVHRIFEKVFKHDFPKVKNAILDPLDNAKSEFVDMQKKWVNELDNNIVKKFGIKKGSKESALVQQFGEGEINLDELKRRAPSKWKDIVEADKWFRKAYDEIIDEVNKSRAVIYPNNPDKLVPKRKDYYRHFTEMNGLSGLKNLFETPAAIDPHLAGTSQYTKPKSKFAGFMQKRGNGPFKRDAVGGFLEYIPAASYSTKIDPMIPKFRELKNSLADRTEDSRNLNTFIEFLDDYANDLSGKTNPFDRVPQKYIPGGRKTFAFLNKLNSRVKANVILGNVSSALAQSANIPIGVAYGKQHAVNGIGRTLTAIFDKSQPMYKSNFLKERYSDQMYRKFDEKWFQQPKKMAEWMIETSDRIGSSFIWNTAYQKALKKGVKNPIQHADYETRKLVAGRGVGEVPLFQKSRTTQMILPFTLEVGNQWRVMGDMVKGKDITGLMTLFLGNYLINQAMEETRGFGVTFDPIQAISEAVNEEDASPVEKGGRVAGEVLSNTPAGQYLANLYPEYGFKIPFSEAEAPTREQFFGERNPQRFGTGLIAMDGVSDPVFKLLGPFGGNQVKKTIQGIDALQKDGVYKEDKLKYPIESNTANTIKGLLFGPSSFGESDAYYDSNNRPLSENQTKAYLQAKEQGKGLEYFKNLQQKRDSNTLQRKIKDVQENKTLTEKEKKEKLERLLKQLRELK